MYLYFFTTFKQKKMYLKKINHRFENLYQNRLLFNIEVQYYINLQT